ncbi:MAG: hypothetical protein KC736_03285 [Candidatus Moranbacteria bacterium]|nr:hypothetical protein [Candidatus Moranbacteria bacterium]
MNIVSYYLAVDGTVYFLVREVDPSGCAWFDLCATRYFYGWTYHVANGFARTTSLY